MGGGEEANITNIKEKAAELKIEQQVVFTGSRADVYRLMHVMDVFVFPSVYEGLPVTMVEAQAAGLSSIISDHVSDECIVTKELVSIKSLDETAKQWAEYIVQRVSSSKSNHIDEIKSAGYDITTAAKELEKFYLRQNEV